MHEPPFSPTTTPVPVTINRSNPERHDKSPVAVAIGNWVHGAEIVRMPTEFLK